MNDSKPYTPKEIDTTEDRMVLHRSSSISISIGTIVTGALGMKCFAKNSRTSFRQSA